jgi:hypothetical protein
MKGTSVEENLYQYINISSSLAEQPFWAVAFLRRFCQIFPVAGYVFPVSFPWSFNIIVQSIFPSQFRPSYFSSAFWFDIQNSFRSSLLVHLNNMTSPFQPTHFYKVHNIMPSYKAYSS